jgi:hypothetical protein
MEDRYEAKRKKMKERRTQKVIAGGKKKQEEISLVLYETQCPILNTLILQLKFNDEFTSIVETS